MTQTHGSKIFVDLCAISFAWILSYYLRFYSGLEAPLGIPDPWLYFKLLPFIAVIWFFTFFLLGSYKRSLVYRSAFLESLDMMRGAALATVAFISFTYFYDEYRYSRLTTLIFAVIHPLFLIAARSLLRKYWRLRLRRASPKRMLIIGTSDKINDALRLCSFNRYDLSQVHAVVCLDEAPASLKESLKTARIPCINEPDDWIRYLVDEFIAVAFIAVNYKSLGFVQEKLALIAGQIPRVQILPDFGLCSQLGMGIDMVGGVPVINVHDSPLQGYGATAKRIMDILLSFILLVVFAPIMAIIALLIKVSSPGPVFYRQERMGLDGETFECLKFRSMPIDAEARSGAVWNTPEDTRATRVGAILRKTSLDEIPQLINVLKGDMSLVGPRPERPVFVNKFRKDIPDYMLRHKVKAGMTGWAQVNGWRGNTSIEKRIECDLFYVQNWSIWLDFKILLLTVEEVLSGRNAY